MFIVFAIESTAVTIYNSCFEKINSEFCTRTHAHAHTHTKLCIYIFEETVIISSDYFPKQYRLIAIALELQ